MPSHYQGYSINQEEGRERFIEGLELVLGSWRQEDFKYQGSFISPMVTASPLGLYNNRTLLYTWRQIAKIHLE
ncbi:MAG: hypothetical protein CM1200mP22_16650 [Dehalococcoidia bacterium]|nr:MAG: hypothetical protein CM1200mP22_16650 [Dehalococcoidia bacterium]